MPTIESIKAEARKARELREAEQARKAAESKHEVSAEDVRRRQHAMDACCRQAAYEGNPFKALEALYKPLKQARESEAVWSDEEKRKRRLSRAARIERAREIELALGKAPQNVRQAWRRHCGQLEHHADLATSKARREEHDRIAKLECRKRRERRETLRLNHAKSGTVATQATR
jgi:hypothetical protein